MRVRSTRSPRPAVLRLTAEGPSLTLAEAEDGVSPGQAAVFYDGIEGQARVLGGGFIRKVDTGRAHAAAAPLLAAAR